VAKFKFILWFAYWYLQAEDFAFEWDKGNSSKSLKKHGINCDEVESVFDHKLAAPIGSQYSPEVEEERLCLLGPSNQGQLLSIVFTLRDGRIRPISCRVTNKKERLLYEKVRKTLERI